MHIPVLVQEVMAGLKLYPGAQAIDCTLGDGGHSREILKKISPGGRLLALDADEKNIKKAQERFKNQKNLILVNDNFVHLKEIVQKYGFTPQSILLDLGWSMTQFNESGKGFSFWKNEPLDMRYSDEIQKTAAEILNHWSEDEIGKILRKYGEEKDWQAIAKAIVQYRKKQLIKTSGQLVEIIENCKLKIKNFRLHPATQVFQALRLAVNDELNVLRQTLPQAVEVLSAGGRLAVISFHSLEDRIIKQFFQKLNNKTIKLIYKKPLVASGEELKNNPRSRSAKLRIIEKL